MTGPEPKNLVIIGPTGSGKSFIVQAIAHNACMGLLAVRYWRLAELAGEIDQLNLDVSATNDLVTEIAKYHLVILDDFFTTEISPHATRVLFEIMEARDLPSNRYCLTARCRRLGQSDAQQSHRRIPHQPDSAPINDRGTQRRRKSTPNPPTTRRPIVFHTSPRNSTCGDYPQNHAFQSTEKHFPTTAAHTDRGVLTVVFARKEWRGLPGRARTGEPR
ncbi:ATP-binding protein [Corynebacterium cystitidis]|uniref:ATP-binding protein n=1 Tax=Corynebacterium cystitidis TaxID=35757 RepID=UPI00358DA935